MTAAKLQVPVTFDCDVAVEQLKAIRLLCSQIGFALDTAILTLSDMSADASTR